MLYSPEVNPAGRLTFRNQLLFASQASLKDKLADDKKAVAKLSSSSLSKSKFLIIVGEDSPLHTAACSDLNLTV